MPRPATKSQIQQTYTDVVRAIGVLSKAADPQICDVIETLADNLDRTAQRRNSEQLFTLTLMATKAVQYYIHGKGIEDLPIGVMTDAAFSEAQEAQKTKASA